MDNKILFGIGILGIMCIVLMSGCITEKETKYVCSDGTVVSDSSMCHEQQKEELICDKHYIKVGNECCLDKDNNSICDEDETTQISNKTQIETSNKKSVGVEDSKKVNETENKTEKIDDNDNLEEISPVISESRENKSSCRRIMLLIDISGSFTEKGETVSKIDNVKIMASSIVSDTDENDYLGVVAFDDNTYTIQHLKGGDLKYFGERKLYKQELIDKILSFTTTHTQGTIMNKALRDAQIEIGSDGGYVILLSDGRLNFKDDENKCIEIAEEMKGDNTMIITVGIGERINTKFLKELSRITNGTYYGSEEFSALDMDKILKKEHN